MRLSEGPEEAETMLNCSWRVQPHHKGPSSRELLKPGSEVINYGRRVRGQLLLAWKMEEAGPEPRNTSSPSSPEKGRKWTPFRASSKESSLAITLITAWWGPLRISNPRLYDNKILLFLSHDNHAMCYTREKFGLIAKAPRKRVISHCHQGSLITLLSESELQNRGAAEIIIEPEGEECLRVTFD